MSREGRADRESDARLGEIKGAILKPLLFASGDGFARLKLLKSAGPLVERLAQDALSLEIDHVKRSAFERLKALFHQFDTLHEDEKKARVTEALRLLDSLDGPPAAKGLSLDDVKRRLKAIGTPVSAIKGVGPRVIEILEGKGIRTVEDLLYYLPYRYEDRSLIKKIRDLSAGSAETTTGEVLAFGEARYGRRRVFEAAIGDSTGILKAKWFHYNLKYMRGRLKQGQRIILYGTVSVFGHQLEMIHPDIESLEGGEDASPSGAGIVPVYSQTENLYQKTIRKIVAGAVDGYAHMAAGGVPSRVLRRAGFMHMEEAFLEAHRPSSLNSALLAKRSLVFDELFMLELGLALKRSAVKKEGGISFSYSGRLEAALLRLLPFSLTGAQRRVLSEIDADMRSSHPMSRLIQGDVGSGKTIVSLISALRAIEAGHQAAIMAPTEILAEQHFLNTHRYADRLGIKARLLTGRLKKTERDLMLKEIREGEADLVIGTHALIQKDVEFKRLGLAVIDEQHRFGVVQRSILKQKGSGDSEVSPDILIMTATPIPRTLSMTVFGDLDVSIIDELPPGRKPVETRLLKESERRKAYELIRREVAYGSQCYVVYPLIEESKELSLKDATNMKGHLENEVFPEFKVGLLHGRMKSDEKESVMRDFKEKRLDILVSTTVIEVGVDVPNATVMLIEHAERFGLAQLHQLRGRVGRGEKRSVCLLLAAWTNSEDTYKRLKVMEATQDGFRIAEEDLKIRGPGDFIGTRQAGIPDFRTNETLADLNLLKKARTEAFAFLEKDPDLSTEEGRAVKEVLRARWEGRLGLAEIG